MAAARCTDVGAPVAGLAWEVDEPGYHRLALYHPRADGEATRPLGVEKLNLDGAVGPRLDVFHVSVEVRTSLREIRPAVQYEVLPTVLLAVGLSLRPHDGERELALRDVLAGLAVPPDVRNRRGRFLRRFRARVV